MELMNTAETITTPIFAKYPKCIKGMDYNGAFATWDKNENVVLVNQEDYEVMEDVIAKYNTIVGRPDILLDLVKRSGME